MMVVIAMVAFGCAIPRIPDMLRERQARFLRIADKHNVVRLMKSTDDLFAVIGEKPTAALTRDQRLLRWHFEMGKKYREAALYPWLPVEPDPPMPK
jgi:hypothetical protein